ncbi:MAG: DUF975 family protein [Prevotella sp.]
MLSSSEFRNLSANTLQGKWGEAAVFTLVYFLIVGGFNMHSTLQNSETIQSTIFINLLALALLPMQWGYYVYFLAKTRQEEAGFAYLFVGYKDFGRIFGTIFLQNIYIVLWSLLFIIPGIVKSFSYAMTPYVLLDKPELSYEAAITRSSQLMRGHKADLFFLYLSFIGWFLLCLFTAGIGFLFLTPYFHTAKAHFYEELLKEEAAFATGTEKQVF